MSDPWDSLREKLEDVHEWPCDYTFKFIMPAAIVDDFVAILGKHSYDTRPSRTGKYTSITAVVRVESSEDVIAFYRAAATFEGVISL